MTKKNKKYFDKHTFVMATQIGQEQIVLSTQKTQLVEVDKTDDCNRKIEEAVEKILKYEKDGNQTCSPTFMHIALEQIKVERIEVWQEDSGMKGFPRSRSRTIPDAETGFITLEGVKNFVN